MKKIAASDSRQSVGLKWKLRKGLEENVAFKEDGTMEVGKNLEVNGNILSGLVGRATLPIKQGGQTLGAVDCWVGEGTDATSGGTPILFAISCMITEALNTAKMFAGPVVMDTGSGMETNVVACKTMDEVITKGYIPLEFLNAYGLASDYGVQHMISSISDTMSDAKYQHTVTLSGDGFEFCFTAKSSKDTPVVSYQDLRTVFGGCRIGLTGFSAALSARPVYIDLHGGTVATDFIRVYNEAGGGFSDKTLSSIGSIRYEDDVCIPK